MQENLLQRIVADKHTWLATQKARQPLATFQSLVRPATRSFYRALRGSTTAFILECKKASPSAGLIRPHFDPVAIATIYQPYAAVVSVLTDEHYFQGSYRYLPLVSNAITQPVLCKDFIIDPWQIWQTRYHQADAVLLMLSILGDEQYQQLAALAHRLQMGVLTEVSNEHELERAIALGAHVVGINNRNLRDLSIDLSRTRQLAPRLPHDVIVISESGIHSRAQVQSLSPFVNGFLIGSALMTEPDLRTAVCRVLLGDNKVCGLTRAEDARAAFDCGAVCGGLIFAAASPRQIDESRARQIINAAPLHYVGVFRNDTIRDIVTKAHRLSLFAVQLHGDEDQEFIDTLRLQLPAGVQIWKALSVNSCLPSRHWRQVDRYVFDNGHGGSGNTFDWSLLRDRQYSNVLLAGGLTASNCAAAAALGCAGLDFNSGVEQMPGIKDAAKLAAAFTALRTLCRR